MDAVPRHFPIKHLVAHCGLAAHFPENSILALLEVAEAGAAIVEFDIQRSADGVPMVIYDASLQRTTATAGAVGNFTASELMALSCGYPVLFGEQFAQIHVPSLLQTVAALAARQDVFVLAEIKDESI